MLAEAPPRVHLDICFDAAHSLLQAVLQPAGQFITGPPLLQYVLQPASFHCRSTLHCCSATACAGQFIIGPPFAAVLLQPASLRVQPPTSLQPALMHCRPTLLCNILQPASLQAHSPRHCNLHLFIAGPLSTPLQLPSLQVASSLQVLQPRVQPPARPRY